MLILYYPLSNLVHTIPDPKGTHMSCPCVIQRCIKTHLYPVAFIGICDFVIVFVSEFLYFILYFVFSLHYVFEMFLGYPCIYVCYMFIKDQSINQSKTSNDDWIQTAHTTTQKNKDIAQCWLNISCSLYTNKSLTMT